MLIKKAIRTSISALLLAAVIVLMPINASSVETQVFPPPFSDHFNGTAIGTNKWMVLGS